jgi:hypothetical protein
MGSSAPPTRAGLRRRRDPARAIAIGPRRAGTPRASFSPSFRPSPAGARAEGLPG